MRCPVIHALAVFVLSSATPLLGQGAAEVRSVIEEHYAAIHAGDLDTVDQHHRSDMTWFPNDGRLMFEAGNAQSAERMGATLDYGSLNAYMSDFHAQLYGDVAVATFYLTGVRTLNGESVNSTSRVTAVWIREDGEWREAHHHESPLRGEIHP